MKKMLCVLFVSNILATTVHSLTLPLPTRGNDITGQNFVASTPGGKITEIARAYDVSTWELIEANPHINPHLAVYSSTRMMIPRQFILPKPRDGIVINLAELRLYYFPKGKNVVMTYPIGIGRTGWKTPTGTTSIVQKQKDPTWYPTPAVKQWIYENRGEWVPDVVPPGPDNPLGPYAMRLGFDQYLIHGTNEPDGVGMRVSSGCIRMYNYDVAELFSQVPVGTKVTIINEPHKAGWHNGQLYLESQWPLGDSPSGRNAHSVIKGVTANRAVKIDWAAVDRVEREQHGIPKMIGIYQ